MLFSKRIEEEIKNSKYTQKQIANLLKISESNITNWKKGDNLPSLEVLYQLCILLNVSADYLLGLEDESGSKYINSFNNFNNSGHIEIK